MKEKILEAKTYVAEDAYNWKWEKDFLSDNKGKLMYSTADKLKFWERKDEVIGITKKEKFYRPVWFIKGYYHCEYLRDTFYRVGVDDNVIKSLWGNQELTINESSTTKFITISDITETVQIHNERTLQIKDYEPENEQETVHKEKTFLGLSNASKQETKKLDLREIKMEVADSVEKYLSTRVDPSLKFSILTPKRTPDSLVNTLKENVVKSPENIKKILKEEFVVMDFRLVYCPVFDIKLESNKGLELELRIDAMTGDLE